MRLGDIDFFSVVARKPTICDFKPVAVEVALARFKGRGSEDEQIQLLRFATVSYTHLRAHETVLDLVCRLLLEKKKK